ncbi:unnamed protein product [Parnassius mnemosyne]|uniref:Integrase catalytic domain-containing protein n=1 Tax=Parnassius mnemosyne TaxID=213953 RepID=A0AAV1KBP0_9NEOP
MIYIYFLKNKSVALDCFKIYKTVVENQLNKKIKKLRTDNGKEYCSKEFEKYLRNPGIIHQKSNPYTPEH